MSIINNHSDSKRMRGESTLFFFLYFKQHFMAASRPAGRKLILPKYCVGMQMSINKTANCLIMSYYSFKSQLGFDSLVPTFCSSLLFVMEVSVDLDL